MRNRKRFPLAAGILASILLLSTIPASAQTEKRLTATPRAFRTFYAKFKSAVLRNDKPAVASMTSFPFKYGWDAGDEGTYTRRQFIRKFDDMFRDTRRLFSRSNPQFYVDGDTYSLTNTADASHFSFVKKGTKYYFASFIVEP